MWNWFKALGSARKPKARDPEGAPEATRSTEDRAARARPVQRPVRSPGEASGGLEPQHRAAVSVDARVHALELELSRQRERTADAAFAAQKEAKLARRALEDAGAARLERDEYRRVLAAAIANEKKALEDARAAREAYDLVDGRLTARLSEEVLARGIADGRVKELERSKSEALARHVHELSEVRDREWAEREDRRREVQRLVFELGESRAEKRALEARLGRQREGPEARALRLRAKIARAVAIFAALLALALAPAALLAAIAPARAAYLTLALGLGPWALTLATLGFGLVALGCASLALHTTRAATREGGPHVDADRATAGAPPDAPSSAARKPHGAAQASPASPSGGAASRV